MSGMPLLDAVVAEGLAASAIPASSNERRIWDLIASHKGYRNPVSIRMLHSVTGLSERAIKDAVAELIVTHKLRIGALRGGSLAADASGYFVIESAEDLAIAVRPYEGQVLAMLRRLRVLQGGKQQIREWLGQLAVEFEK